MINSVNSAFADPTVLGSFAANHDSACLSSRADRCSDLRAAS